MKKTALAAVALTLALSLGAVAGCSSGGSAADNSTSPEGAPTLMPANHQGRFEDLGADGCYGCHGANEKANPQLASATVIPEDHYLNGMYETLALDPVREQCNTCHSQG